MSYGQSLHSGYFHPEQRKWQSSGTEIHAHNLMLPMFIIDEPDERQEIENMPDIPRLGVNLITSYLKPIVEQGLGSVILFGVMSNAIKDKNGSAGYSGKNPVVAAIDVIKKNFPSVFIGCDVCLCPYTDHGHCGILNSDGSLNNQESIEALAKQALCFANAGANMVCPSDMNDGRVCAIRTKLVENGYQGRVSILSYAVKFASGFYGPFREAAKSAPAFGDRKRYQLPFGGRGLALRAAARDVFEGADMLMVKPAMAYLDIIRDVKLNYAEYPLFAYQVSGEYAMINNAAAAGIINFENVLIETLVSMRRAGADVIISYFTPKILKMIIEKKI